MRDGLSGPNHPRRNLSEPAGLLKTALFLTDMRAGPHTSRAPGVSAPRGRAPRHWAGEPGPRRRGKSGSPPLPPRERRFRPRWGGAARAPRPRPPRGPAPKSARFPRPACSPRASLPVSGSASPGPDSVTRTAGKTVCQRRPGGNGSRTPPLAIRPRGERQGARSPGGETRSPARAGAPPSLPAPSHLTAGSTVHSPGASPRLQVPASRAGHVRPAVARPAPGEGPAGSRPLGPRPGVRSLPGASPAGPRPAPALRRAGPSRRLTRPARLSFPVRPGGRTLGGSGRATGECHPAAGPEGTGEASGPPRRWRRGRPSFPLSRARASLLCPFVFDPLVSQEEEARLSAFCSRTRTLRGHASPCRQGRPRVQGGPTPAARLSPPGDLGGGAREACRQLRPWLGGHVHLLEKDGVSPCPVFPERHPSPGPGGSSPGPGVPGSRREAAGGACRAPGTLTLPVSSARRLEEGGGGREELIIRLPLALPCLGAFIYSSLSPSCPQWSRPFQKFSAGNREADREQELGEPGENRFHLT